MPYYFMRDTPLQAMEQLMMSQPGQKPRGGGIYRSPFHYTPKDVACKYCQNYLSRIEQNINDNGFTTRRATEQDLKKMLGVYFEQNVTTEKFEDFDGDRWVIVGE